MKLRLSLLKVLCLVALGGQAQPYFSTVFDQGPTQQSGWGVAADEQDIFVTIGAICNPGFQNCDGVARFNGQGELVAFDPFPPGILASGSVYLQGGDNLDVLSFAFDPARVLLRRYNRSSQEWEADSENLLGNFYSETSNGYQQGAHYGYHKSWVDVSADDEYPHYRILFIDKTTRQVARELLMPLPEPYHNVATSGLLELPDGTLLGVGAACGLAALCGVVTRFDTLGTVLWRTYLNTSAWHSEQSIPRAVNLPNDRIGVLWRVSPANAPIDERYVFYVLDTLGAIISEQELTPDDTDVGSLEIFDMLPARSGGAFLFGLYNDYRPVSREIYGYVARLDEVGNVVWERKITDDRYADRDALKFIGDLEELPNGDLVLVGDMYLPAQPGWNIAAWLLRLDSLGCLTPGCGEWQVLTATADPGVDPEPAGLRVYPNPASGSCWVELPAGPRWRGLQVYDARGQLVQQLALPPGNAAAAELKVAGLPPGLYLLQATADNGRRAAAKLVVRE